MYGQLPGETVAACRIEGATGNIIGNPLNVASCVRAAKGVYVVTLNAAQGVDNTNAVALATTRTGAANNFIDAVQNSDTTVGVTIANTGGDLADADFCLLVVRTAP